MAANSYRRARRYLSTGVGVFWRVSLIAVLEPARRAASVPPAVAARSI